MTLAVEKKLKLGPVFSLDDGQPGGVSGAAGVQVLGQGNS